MANKKLFGAKPTDAINEAGGNAYALTAKQALAQYAATGCLNGTYYASAGEQLANVLGFCAEVDDVFIARTAIYCRERGLMKDMPALLCALLASRNVPLLEAIFPRVIDNGKMLRTFVQILRSGTAGRKSLGPAPKRMVRRWLERTSAETLFRASVGQSPSLVDVIRMVHPKPESKEREALYGYLLRRPHDAGKLPALVSAFEKFKYGATAHVPDVPFQMLTSLALDSAAWTEIARNAPWQMTRMNLKHWNRFRKHNPKARLVCIDLQPYATTQAQEREDVLNIGGFSDEVFTTIAEFAAGRLGSGHWTGIIDNIALTESEVA